MACRSRRRPGCTAYGVELPELRWGYVPDGEGVIPNGSHGGMDAWRDRFKGRREQQWEKGAHRGGHHGLTATTPPEFRDVLIEMARSSTQAEPVSSPPASQREGTVTLDVA